MILCGNASNLACPLDHLKILKTYLCLVPPPEILIYLTRGMLRALDKHFWRSPGDSSPQPRLRSTALQKERLQWSRQPCTTAYHIASRRKEGRWTELQNERTHGAWERRKRNLHHMMLGSGLKQTGTFITQLPSRPGLWLSNWVKLTEIEEKSLTPGKENEESFLS